MTNQDNITRINNFISDQITNLEANNLLSWSDKANIAEILLNLSGALAALRYASIAGKEEGEGWRDNA